MCHTHKSVQLIRPSGRFAPTARTAGREHAAGALCCCSRGPEISLHTFLLACVLQVRCTYTGKPAWSQNDAAVAAFREGADYVLRTNDDTEMPVRKDWASAFIADLRGRPGFPNVGVVGPASDKPPQNVLTHDFTHRTHVMIHGFYYPRSMPTW